MGAFCVNRKLDVLDGRIFPLDIFPESGKKASPGRMQLIFQRNLSKASGKLSADVEPGFLMRYLHHLSVRLKRQSFLYTLGLHVGPSLAGDMTG